MYMLQLAELLDRLSMNSHESQCPIPDDQKTDSKATELAEEFVDKYVDLQLPGLESKENMKRFVLPDFSQKNLNYNKVEL